MNPFPTTIWSMIRAVGRDETDRVNADEMNVFIESYWKPVFCFIRARGYAFEEAEDLTQAFFLELVNKRWVDIADQERGRFRTFLLFVLKRFLSDQGAARIRRQTQFERRITSVSSLMADSDREYEPSTELTPERIFMSEWAAAAIDVTCRRLRDWCDAQEQPNWYPIFEATTRPALDAKPLSQRVVAERFSLTREQVRHAIRVTRDRFVQLLREELSEQVTDAKEVEDEARELEGYLRP